MIIQKRGILPVSAFVAGIGLAFSAYAQTAVNLFTNPRFTALAEKTLYAGLRRAGFPDE